MERLSDNAIEIVNELHTERLAYEGEYVPIIDALNRLAEYEDIGLEPEKIVFLKNVVADAFSDKPEFTGHIRELLRTEKDGRLVVLPCKVGDELWSFSTYPTARVYGFTVTDISTLNGRTVLNTLGCGTLWERDIGKTVFLTREEAERALEGNNESTV